jgi:hypothetical protein
MSRSDSKPEKTPEKHGEAGNRWCSCGGKHSKGNHKCGLGEKYGGDRNNNVAAVSN